jgi:hypothetical protein
MKKSQTTKRKALTILAMAFVVTGTYNSIMVNSDEFMEGDNVQFIKRLDEVNGVVQVGRRLANQTEWVKLVSKSPKLAVARASESSSPADASAPAPVSVAAITKELNLELTEVFNAKKYPQGTKDFKGSLAARDGVLESIEVSLPEGESFQVAFSEMTGNVFTYDIDGQELSGMMYQMDENAYMITLTNGPFEGTRLKFSAAQEEQLGNDGKDFVEETVEVAQAEQTFEPVINDDGTQTEVGQFGAPQDQQPATAEVAQAEESEEPASTFNFQNAAATF